ncbi:HlyD family secretion protein [Photobacterium sp. OFAV2-7]|uniref:HlyD family secretion protein n=1 Tax=Photobacterium sp. OFAV2-7 TaxID=2917748 RepID=UPI001EF58A88|nr:HlyD family secretion protein [Photobacterium sp. OFAV2-7]MCG7588150.1 HlyD family secretion protein [Photobacterium sp. OFAV2-7]
MNADQQFKSWMRFLIAFFFLLFAYIVIADRHAPLTTEGRVQGYVVQVAPEVTGKITQVFVTNNQKVKQGDALFEIDERKYRIALDKATLSLRSALEKEETLYSQREAALANISRARANYNNTHREYQRLEKLSFKKVISQSNLDNAAAQDHIAKATLRAQEQNLKVIETQLGDEKGKSTAVLLAQNMVNSANLDLSYTVVTAPSDGVVTNLQLEVGTMARVNAPLLTFVPTGSMWVAADFREKSVAGVDGNYSALVTFDANPGEVYRFSIKSRDYGVAAAQQQPNGSLTQVEKNNRWVRDAQRTRVNLENNEHLPNSLFVGSRATIVLYPSDSAFWSLMATTQAYLASWFHFIY